MSTSEHALNGQDQRTAQGHCVDALKSGLGISNDVDTGLPHSRALTTTRPEQSTQPVPQIVSNLSSIRLGSDMPSSIAGGPRRSPCRAFMDHVSNLKRTAPPFDVPLFPSGYDLAQSATEVATPSNAGTPAMRGLDEAFHMVKTGIDDLSCDTNGFGMILPSRPEAGAFLARNCDELSQSALFPLQGKGSAPWAIASDALPARIENLIAQIASLKDILLSTPNFKTSLFTLNHRIDALETTSFSHQSVDGLEQKVELFDARLLEIEGKVEELEKLSSFRDEDGVYFHGRASKRRKSAHLNQDEVDSFTSHASVDSNASFHSGSATSKAEAVERLETLEERLEKLEASVPPCLAQPWEVEVVLLPWGRELKGIWFSMQDHFSHSLKTTSEHSADPGLPSRLQNSGVLRSPRDESSKNKQSQAFEEWVGGHEGWLSAYACSSTKGGGRGTIYKRLKSRGLVRIVNIHGNTAREVHFAISSAFEDIMDYIGSSVRETFTDAAVPLGLQAPLIPLRKIRKSSRLNFLSPAEIANPSIWTADFLNSTVFMKAAGQKTLFITSPAAYLQSPDRSGEWTWQKLRELPRHQPGSVIQNSENSFVAEADAKESCWTYNPRLDPSVSVHSSLASRARGSLDGSFASHPLSPQATDHAASDSALDSESDSDHEFRAPAHFAPCQITTVKPPAPIKPLSEIPSAPRPFRRTISLPLSDPNLNVSDQVPKRQINSFEQFTSTVKTSLPKRRRLSQTPEELEAENDKAETNPPVWNLTPRRSREPPSPYAYGTIQQQQQQQVKSETAVVRKRATTPLAYATPYSNTLGPRYAHLGVHVGADGDTDMDDDDNCDEEDRDGTRAEEEAWEGVDDDKDDGDVSIDLSSAEIDDDFSPGEEEDDADDDDDDEVMGDAEVELELELE